MNEIYILYAVVTYLFTFGIVLQAFVDGQDSKSVYLGMVVHLVFAPILTPVVFGWITYDRLN